MIIKRKYKWRDEFLDPKSTAALVTGGKQRPGPGEYTITNTETCLSIVPRVGTAIITQAGVTFGGSNNRCSYGPTSWMDFPTGFDAAAHAGLGRIVIMFDSAGVGCWAYLGAAGTGETLGSELVTNGNMESGDPPTGYTALNSATLSSAADERTGGAGSKSINAVRGTNASAARAGSFSTDVGSLMKVNLWQKNIDLSTGVYSTAYSNTTIYTAPTVASTSWNESTGYFAVNAAYYLYLNCNGSAGQSGRFDDLSLKQVLTPSATGCYAYKDAALTTAGWNKPTAFNMNSASYTFGIYEPQARGRLFFMGGKSTPAYGDPGYWKTEAITRQAGRIVAWKVNINDVTKLITIGLDSSAAGIISSLFFGVVSSTLYFRDGTLGASITVSNISNNIDIYLAIITRSPGGAYFAIKIGTGYWKIVGATASNTTTPLVPGISDSTATGYADFIRSPNYLWLPRPLISDNFAGADGTADGRVSNGLGHAETTGLGSGGAGISWSGANGAIVSNRLVITPTLGEELITVAADRDFSADTGFWTKGAGWSIGSNVATKIDGGASGSLYCSLGVATNFYQLLFDLSGASGGSIYAYHGTSYFTTFTNGAKSYTGRATGTVVGVGGDKATLCTVDNISFKQISIPTCFQTVTLDSKDVELRAKFTLTNGTQAGIVFGLDADCNNYGLLYHGGNGSVYLYIFESGTTGTQKSVKAIAAAADAEMVVRRDDTAVWCYYNGTLLDTLTPTVTLTAGENSNLSGLRVGAFSTSSLNSFSSFVANFVGTNNEFSILDRLIGGA